MLGDALSGLPILILSTHELREASAAEIANAARVHQFSILLRQGRWELLQTPWLTARQPPAQAQVAGFAGADLLTARERETLARLAEGASNKAVARALGISPRTVEFHRANIMRKLHARSFAELLARVHTGG
ncbi:MAG: helix-turn-helix transcriptional regulator [Alphaproteobacteria bacterium]|nr:helix-turn-helix transcriptional regulator [Alphaproteobacteria bacterium]